MILEILGKMQKQNGLLRLAERAQERILRKYQMFAKPGIANVGGIKVPIGNHISAPIRQAIYSGEYEKPELKTVKSNLFPDDIVMEIGTGIGLISTFCAKRIGSGRVFTYEANPALEQFIYDTYKLNNVHPTLEICLLGEQNGEQKFYLEKDFWASSIIPWGPDRQFIQVPMKSFNQEVKRLDPTFLIIDIEGGEYELLKNANFYNIRKISIELHENQIGHEKINLIKSRLSQAGFQVNKDFCSMKGDLEELFFQR